MTRFRAVLLAAVVAVVLVLVLVISREGPDRSVTGTITELQSHQVCVSTDDVARVCVGVDEPELLDGFAFGDCVRLRYSAQELLSSVDHAANECRRV